MAIVLVLVGIQVISPPAEAANPNSTASCGVFGTGLDMGDITVAPLHGKAFYTDIKNGVNATYVGYSIHNDTAAALDNIWVSIENFRAVSGTSVLNIANSADADQPVIPADPTTTPVGRIPAGAYSYVYFLIKASDVATFAQRHDIRIYRGEQSSGGQSYGAAYNCYYEFSQVTRTLAASANKVTSVSVDTATPKFGGVVTVTVNGATGVGGAGDGTLDGSSMWLSPASVASWPTRALRLEGTSVSVKYNKNGNTDSYSNILMVKNINTNPTAFKSATTYVATYKFRVIGTASSNAVVHPVAQIASGTQMKHTSSYPATISLVNVTTPAKTITVTKSIDSTFTITQSAGFWYVRYKILLSNADSSDVVVDEALDIPDASVYLSTTNAVTYTDKYRTNATLIAANASPATAKDSSGRYHFVGPFTVAAKVGSTNGTASILYVMKIPVPTSSGTTVTYNNQAYGAIGPTLFGSSTTGTSVTQCPFIINSDGSVNSTTSCTTVTPNKLPQSITFNQPPPQGAGTSYTLDATASSGLAVTYTVASGPCTLSGSTIIYNSEGSCVINADQDGDVTYDVAMRVSRTVTILPGQTINFGATVSMSTSSSQTVTITATSGLYVTLTSLDTTICTVGSTTGSSGSSYTALAADNNVFKITSLTLSGNCPLTASQAGDGITWGPALSVDRTVPVGLKNQVLNPVTTVPSTQSSSTGSVTWSVSANDATTSALLPNNNVTFTSITPSVCSSGAETQSKTGSTVLGWQSTISWTAAGICIIQADQDGYDSSGAQSGYAPATAITTSFVIGATPNISLSVDSAVKSGGVVNITATVTKPSGTTAALNGTVTLQASGDTTSATTQTSSTLSLDTATNSGTKTFTVNSSALAAAAASGSIVFAATFSSSDASYNSSQTTSSKSTEVYSPALVTITTSASTVFTSGTVTATVTVQGNAPQSGIVNPAGSVTLTINAGGTSSPSGAKALTLGTSGTGLSTASYTLTAGTDPATDIVIDAGYTPSGTSTNYFNSVATSSTPLTDRTIDVVAPNHTVTFMANGGSGSMSAQTTNVQTSLTANTFTRGGYSFVRWDTSSGGTGTSYADRFSYDFSADVTLYAVWSANTNNAITYDDNSATTAHVGGASTYTTGSSFTLPTAPSRTGYSFAGWQMTGANVTTASIVSLAISATPSGYGAVTLTAQWSLIPSHTVTFMANGGSGSMSAQTTNVQTALTTNTFTRSHYAFGGWNTQSNGSGTSYANSYLYNFNADMTLYAVWMPLHTVVFNGNGANNGSPAAAAVEQASPGASVVTVGKGTLTKKGSTFLGWALNSTDIVPTYAVGDSYAPNSDVTLYAVWRRDSFTVHFRPNYGTNADTDISTQTAAATVNLTSPSMNRVHQEFLGWNTQQDGLGTSYDARASYDFLDNLTLYAQWAPLYTVTFDVNTADSGSASAAALEQVTHGTGVTASSNGTMQKAGFTFAGWSQSSTSNMVDFQAGDSVVPSTNMTLFAVWRVNNHRLIYNANSLEATGLMNDQVTNLPASLHANAYVRSGYQFLRWDTNPGGDGVPYYEGDSWTFANDVALYAQWGKLNTVVFDPNNGSGAPEYASQSQQTFGSSINAANRGSLTRQGYSFLGWANSAGATAATVTPGSSLTPAADVTYFAVWARNSYKVTFHNNDGGGDTPEVQSSDATQNLVHNSFNRDGYVFSGWNTQADGLGQPYQDGESYPFLDHLTLYAQWRVLGSNDAIFDANGGTGSMGRQTRTSHGNLTKNAFSRDGFEFLGWSTNSDGSGDFFSDESDFAFDSTKMFYAKWQQLEHGVTFDPNGAPGLAKTQRKNQPQNLSSNSFVRQGYEFRGWSTMPDGTGEQYSDGDQYDFVHNLVLYAKWQRAAFRVHFKPNYGADNDLSIQEAAATADLSYPSPSRAHFAFRGWSSDAEGAHPYSASSYDFLDNLTLFAQWDPLYTVAFDANGASGEPEFSSAEQSAAAGSVSTPARNTMTKRGHRFLGWATQSTKTSADYSAGDALAPSSSVTLFAVWTPNSYVVQYDGNGNDSGNAPSGAEQLFGSTVIVSSNTGSLAKPGYRLASWNSQANGSGTTYAATGAASFVQSDTPVTLYAQWQRITYTVTFEKNDGGILATRVNRAFDEGDSTVLDFAVTIGWTRPGYTFVGWGSSSSSTTPLQSFTANATANLYALWTANSYVLSFDSGPGVARISPVTLAFGTRLLPIVNNITRPVRPGYQFVMWSIRGAEIRTGATMPASDTLLVAVWTPDTVVVPPTDPGVPPVVEPITPAAPSIPTLPEPVATGGPAGGTSSIDRGANEDKRTDPASILEALIGGGDLGKMTLTEIPSTRFTGFVPGESTRVQATGARTSAQFISAGAQALDVVALSQALAESTKRNTTEFAQVTNATPVAPPAKTDLVAGPITRDAALTFRLSGLAQPVTVGSLKTSQAKSWIRLDAAVATYVPGSIVYLAVTTSPIILGATIVGKDGRAALQGFLPADLLAQGGHNIRVVGTRAFPDIRVDSQGGVRLSETAMQQIKLFDEGTKATIQVVGKTGGGGTHLAVREIPLDKNVPWWALWVLLVTGLIAGALRLFAKAWNAIARVVTTAVVGAVTLLPVILGWITSSYELMGLAALTLAASMGLTWIAPKWNLRRRASRRAR